MTNLGTAIALVGALRYLAVIRPDKARVGNANVALPLARNVLKWHGPKF